MPMANVRYEQAVYGSFSFWHRGYGLLAHSAGCRPEWLADLRAVCQRYGELPAGATFADSLFALRIKSGAWMIVGVFPQGCDDHNRPGALAFHALFLNPWAYRWAGADPFAYSNVIRGNWRPEDLDRTLPTGNLRVRKPWLAGLATGSTAAHDDTPIGAIVAASRGSAACSFNRAFRLMPWRAAYGSLYLAVSGVGRRSPPGSSTAPAFSIWSRCPGWRAST